MFENVKDVSAILVLMPRVRVARTLVEDVFGELRADILGGRLEPGSRLKMSDLSTRLGVSLSVLREALSRLVEQGLVTLEPQVGFRVVSLSPDELVDLTAARVQIEVAALRASIRHGDLAWESAVLGTHHALARTPPLEPGVGVSPAWVEAHAAFHQALIGGCGSKRLLDIACSLRESAELYRQWSTATPGGEGRDVVEEHRLMCEAALDRDEERAAALLTEHIERTTAILLEGISGS